MRVNKILPSPFFGNYFCLIPNTNVAFVAISKNAVTFLKKVAYYNAYKVWVQSFDEIHGLIGYTADSPFLVPIENMKKYEETHGDLIKIAVWRDPLDRIISTYSLFCVEKEYRSYFHYLGLINDITFDEFMAFLDYEWAKKYPLWQDEHIRRQVDYYSVVDVDYIIHISKLNSFLNEINISFEREQSNKTNTSYEVLNQSYLDKIRAYYKEDYDIICNY